METSLFKNLIENLKVKISFIFKRNHSPNVSGGVNNQDAIIKHQAITHIDKQENFGVSAKDTMDIAKAIVDQQINQYHEIAQQTFITRTDSLHKRLLSEIQNLTPEERKKFADPDTRLALGEALRINGTLRTEQKREILLI